MPNTKTKVEAGKPYTYTIEATIEELMEFGEHGLEEFAINCAPEEIQNGFTLYDHDVLCNVVGFKRGEKDSAGSVMIQVDCTPEKDSGNPLYDHPGAD